MLMPNFIRTFCAITYSHSSGIAGPYNYLTFLRIARLFQIGCFGTLPATGEGSIQSLKIPGCPMIVRVVEEVMKTLELSWVLESLATLDVESLWRQLCHLPRK